MSAPIPRIIHRVWIDDPMPEQVVEYGARWRKMHPDWKVLDWTWRDAVTDYRNADLIDGAEVFHARDPKRFASDLIRLNILYCHGGVYVDTDTYPLHPLDDLVKAHPEGFLARSPQSIGDIHPFTNAVMAFPPLHPVMHAAIIRAKAFAERYAQRPTAQRSGPWLLTDVVMSDARQKTFHELPTAALYPMTEEEERDAWVVHQWNSAARKRGEGF